MGKSTRFRRILGRILVALCLLQVAGVAATTGAPVAAAAPANGGARHLLGTAVDIFTLDGHPEVRDIVERYGFSWMTDPGFMFMPAVLTARDIYNYDAGDRLTGYANSYGLQMLGHALVDPRSAPAWLVNGYRNGTITKQEVRTIYADYITKTVTRYCGKIPAWNVINEPFADTGDSVYRTNSGAAPDQNMFWYEIFDGPSYITQALTLTRDACPSAKRYINDYGIEWVRGVDNVKAARVVPVAQNLKAQGLLDGIGFEGHFHKSIAIDEVKAAMNTFAGLGLEVAFTELELRMVHAFPDPNPANAGKAVELTPNELNEQARIYAELAKLCNDNPSCTRFTVWGIDDQSSFANINFGPDAALLFRYDNARNLVAKPAYFSVASALGITIAASPTLLPPGSLTNLTAVPNTLASATIAWETQSIGDSQVYFGTDTTVNMGCATASCMVSIPRATALHVVPVRNLRPATTYYYVVRTTNSAGSATSTTGSFSTPSLEIVGTSKSADGAFAAMYAVPDGATTLAWTTDGATTHPIQGAPTALAGVIAFAGNVATAGGAPGTYTLTVLATVGGSTRVSNTATLMYDPSLRPTFSDVNPNVATPENVAIYNLAGRGIVQGSDGRYRPGDPIVRAEVAAIAARASGWRNERGINSFSDQGVVDNDLWNSVRVLADYDVARGFGDGTFQPLGNVVQAQAISLFTRAMVGKGYWQYQADNHTLFPEVPDDSGHRVDLVTFQFYTNALTGFFSGANYARPAERSFVARVAWETVKWREAQGVAP